MDGLSSTSLLISFLVSTAKLTSFKLGQEAQLCTSVLETFFHKSARYYKTRTPISTERTLKCDRQGVYYISRMGKCLSP